MQIENPSDMQQAAIGHLQEMAGVTPWCARLQSLAFHRSFVPLDHYKLRLSPRVEPRPSWLRDWWRGLEQERVGVHELLDAIRRSGIEQHSMQRRCDEHQGVCRELHAKGGG